MAQAAPRVVVIGGGFAGATAARALKQADPRIAVTLVETSRTFTACPFSNLVIGGLRELPAQQFGYDKVAADGIEVAFATATGVDAQARTVDARRAAPRSPTTGSWWRPASTSAGTACPATTRPPPRRCRTPGRPASRPLLLRRQLEAMEDGGVVVMSAPANPFRCPPGPYERASLIANYLKTRKPKSKLIVLDAKDAFSKQRLFQNAWKELYPDHLEWVALSKGGKVTSVEVADVTLVTDFGRHKAAVANVIPPQKAGRIAEIAGVADATGWCPIDPVTFESKRVPNDPRAGRRHHRRRHAEVGVLRQRAGQGRAPPPSSGCWPASRRASPS